MHIIEPPTLLGLPLGVDRLVLSKRERETLRRASTLAERVRAFLSERYGWDAVEASPLDMLLADVEHSAAELIDDDTFLLPYDANIDDYQPEAN